MMDGSTLRRWIGLALLLLLLAGCPPKTPPQPKPTPLPPPLLPKATLERVNPLEYPQFVDEGDAAGLLRSIDMSLAYLRRLPENRVIHYGADPYPVAHLKRSLEEFARIIGQAPDSAALNRIIRERFHVYRSVGRPGSNDVLFTGYYEPLLPAGRIRTSEYTTPVHSKPKDMVEIDLSRFAPDLKGRTIVGQYTGKTVVPYPSRKQIRETSGFNETAPPIVWLRDDIDLLILQIQGSGRVKLKDGSQLHILYDGSNGLPYRSIGKLLINEGRISREKMSMQAIRSYLRRHPKLKHRILDHNPRYIFFRPAHSGPFGALGQPLTPMRSLAVDRAIMPSAALAFISVPMAQVTPKGKIDDWRTYRGFALAQDAGSAIKGPGRIDLFTGSGLEAEVAAGHLKHVGTLHFLVLKEEAPPVDK